MEDIARIVQDNFPDDSYFLVDIKVRGNPGNEKIVVLVDGDRGIDMETLSAVSRSISGALDRMDLFSKGYSLEVSSPGVDYPLKSVRQYRKNIGKKLMVVLNDQRSVRGELTEADDDGIIIRHEQRAKKQPAVDDRIQYADIKKSKVLVTFK